MMGKNIVKTALLLIVFFLLISQYLQKKVEFVKVKPLKGSFVLQEKPPFDFKSFISMEYQRKFTEYIEQHISFRPFLIRLKNQIDFVLFKYSSVYNLVIGKENYLFEENYVKEYSGDLFIGYKNAEERLCKLKFIQDELKKKGVDLIIAFSPGKASFYPEYIPDKYLLNRKSPSNYKYFRDKCKALGLNTIDFNQYLINMKDTATWPVYPKHGIHWSVYGMSYCVDSLVNYIGKIKNVEMVDFGWNGLDITTDHRDSDDDVMEGMNLLFKLPDVPMAYPRLTFKENTNTKKPSLMCISDSFYWNIFGAGISGRLFDRNDFWFYYIDINNGQGGKNDINSLDLKKEFESHEIILLMATEATLDRFPFGFIEDAYRLYFPQDDANRARLFKFFMQNDSTWNNEIKAKANSQGISFENALKNELNDVLNYDTSVIYSKAKIDELINNIRSDKNLYGQKLKKAAETSIPVHEILKQDALWIIKNGDKSHIQRFWPIKWR